MYMKKITISNQDIVDYIFPEFETLKSLLSELHLEKSLNALLLLESIIKIEIKQKNKN